MRFLNKGVGKPEFRLPLSIVGAFALPLAVAAYGWAAELRMPLLVLLFAVCAMGTALMLAMIPVMAYVVDAFGLYSASAMTGIIVTRCLMSTFLPLATVPLVDLFGFGWGFSVFAVFSLLMAPIPVIMLRYGGHWRRLSRYTRDEL
jgi:MFS family permease